MIRVAIIGAGLSGLSLANLLGHKLDVTLFEKNAQCQWPNVYTPC